LEPGQSALVQFRLEGPVVARAGDRFVVRFYSPVTTIGGGVILDPWPRRRARLRTEELEFLQGAETTETAERVRQAVAASPEGASELDLAVCIGVSPIDLKQFLGELARSGLIRKVGGPASWAVRSTQDGAAGRWFAAEAFEQARKAVLVALAEGHARDQSSQGISLESIRSSVSGPAGLVNAALSDLQQQGAIRVEGSLAALAGHEPRLSRRQQELADRALARIRDGGLMPPALKELASALKVDQEEVLAVLKFMVERRKLVPVTADLYFDAGEISALRDRVARLLADGRSASPSEFRQTFEVSRKYLIPLLEHLDSIGLTRRRGDTRVLKQAATKP
ncbi:MAG: SelB C-terminal domain-containing protein, partial [Gemmatimonadota bacterium]